MADESDASSNLSVDPRHIRGRRGERLAAAYLVERDWNILDRNLEAPMGEIDLVASKTETLGPRELRTVAIVEVKARETDRIPPEWNVTQSKRRTLVQLGKWYVLTHPVDDATIRFDVVAVFLDEEPPDIEHYPAAFDALGRIR